MIPRGKGIWIKLLFLVSLVGLMNIVSPANCQKPPLDLHQNIYFVQWQGNVFSWHRQGFACWVTDAAGNLRFEIMVGGASRYPANLKQLLNWTGTEGWTAISVGGQEGTFSRWQEEWQDLPPSLNTWLMVIAHALATDRDLNSLELPSGVREVTLEGRPLPSFKFLSFDNSGRVRRLQLPLFTFENPEGDPADVGFRKKMARRGRGRGGPQTILNFAGDASSSHGMVVSSTHQPGTLILAQLRAINASYKPEEVFLPWWPLSGYISLEDSK